jgi:hypothetical protein
VHEGGGVHRGFSPSVPRTQVGNFYLWSKTGLVLILQKAHFLNSNFSFQLEQCCWAGFGSEIIWFSGAGSENNIESGPARDLNTDPSPESEKKSKIRFNKLHVKKITWTRIRSWK